MRGVLFSVIFCIAAFSCGSAQEVLRVGMFPNVTHAQALVAANMTRTGKGWFESRLGGPVKIEWFVYNAGPSAMEGLFTKAVEFTYVGPSPVVNAYSRANGKEIRVIAGAMRGGEALVVRRDDIKTPEDFRGKTIATPQLGNTQDVECRAWLIEHGIKVTLVGGDARVIPTANPDIFSLFQQGKVDAAWTVEPWVTRLVNEAGGRVFYAPEDAVTTVLAAREDVVTGKPELTAKFAAAHKELTEWVKANPEEAQQMARDELTAINRREISSDLVKKSWASLKPSSEITLEPFETFQEQCRLVGFLRAQVDLSKLVEIPK